MKLVHTTQKIVFFKNRRYIFLKLRKYKIEPNELLMLIWNKKIMTSVHSFSSMSTLEKN
jgi:hypothetical protein